MELADGMAGREVGDGAATDVGVYWTRSEMPGWDTVEFVVGGVDEE